MRMDLHVHTKESSECGTLPAREIVDMYKNAGYDGIVVTDHALPRYVKKFASAVEMLKVQREGYFAAKEYADTIGFTVLYGCEFRFTEAYQTDFLVYGSDPDYFIKRPELLETPIEKALPAMRADGLLVYQAHPFRDKMQITSPALLDGIEVYNGHNGYDSRNGFAMLWAEQYCLKKISGSDFHKPCDLARGGILTNEDVTDSAALVKCLKEQTYQLIVSLN